jgi:hypothetical protein
LNEVLELLEEEGQKKKRKNKEENTAKEIRKRALDNCTPKKGITLDIPVLEFNWMCILNCACNPFVMH